MNHDDEKNAARIAALSVIIIRCLRQEYKKTPKLVESKSLISENLLSDIYYAGSFRDAKDMEFLIDCCITNLIF